MKRCSKCGQFKPESDFWRKRRKSISISSRCKDCSRAAHRAYYHQHRAEFRQRQRRWQRKHPLAGGKTTRSPEQQARYTKRITRFYKDHPDRQFAKAFVREAAKRGERLIRDPSLIRKIKAAILFKPPYCPTCGRATPVRTLHGHHHKGYGKPTDVLFVCQKCHGGITVREREAVLEGLSPVAGLARFIQEKRAMVNIFSQFAQNPEERAYNELSGDNKQEVQNAG